MAEYIERAELFRFADEIDKEYIGRYTKPVLNMNSLRYLAKQLPAADVAPVRRGRWIEHEIPDEPVYGTDYECSVCGKFQYDNSNFCPNCGADMRGE